MKLTTKTLRQMTITDAPSPPNKGKLDPIHVVTEDIQIGAGRITITCWGKSWSSFWGAMGSRTIAEFFCDCDTGYLVENLTRGQHFYKSRYSNDALVALCKRVIRMRRKGTTEALIEYDSRISKSKAAELMEKVSELDCETEADCWRRTDLFDEIFGPDGVQTAVQANEPNLEYEYLARIVEVVQSALEATGETSIEERVLRAADGVIAMATAAALTLTVEQVPTGTPRMGGYETIASVRLTNAERRRVEALAKLKEAA